MSRTMLLVLAFSAWSGVQVVTGQQKPAGLVNDLLTDVTEVESKITSLATRLPDSAWEWRPGPGVRSSAEVLVHIAGDNYLMPAALGIAVPAATGIDLKQNASVEAFEK